MAISYNVKAKVVDITNSPPKANDTFLVDTNVWYWMTYPNATIQRRGTVYPNYINDALAIGSTLYHSGLSLAELTHLVEKTERDIYSQYVKSVEPKEYRHNNASERSRVVAAVRSVWGQVSSLAGSLPLDLTEATTNTALDRLAEEKVDGYDLFILETMSKNDVKQIITDDGDFSSVPGIVVFTSNRNVIKAAKDQDMLSSYR